MSLPQPEPRDDQLTTNIDDRWELLRDVLVLQAKLILEGIRDIALGPIAIAAGILGLLRSEGRDRARYLHGVLRAGYRFDDWINLYGPLGRLPEEERKEILAPPNRNVDSYFEKLEQVLVEQYEKGGVTKTAKDKIDLLISGVDRKSRNDPNVKD
ncbi:MAG: hypothetical protein GY725_22435 [bacterium]|nr:hypothetical protein [bacterium]